MRLLEVRKKLFIYLFYMVRFWFVSGSEITVDDKAWLMQAVPSMRVVDTVYYFYPRLLPVVRYF